MNKRKRILVICKNCGKEFHPLENSKGLFCSTECARNYRSEELYKEFCTNPDKFTGRMNMRFVKKHILAEQNNKCAICGMPNVWNDKELIFILDHIDGDASNNKRNNFRLICPNCDSQLDTYKSKNKNGSRYYYRYGKKN
jgi:endogenous inhibitor of DNA gyrase (YacG/DUF329 family)